MCSCMYACAFAPNSPPWGFWLKQHLHVGSQFKGEATPCGIVPSPTCGASTCYAVMLDMSILTCFKTLVQIHLQETVKVLRFAVPYESSWVHSGCTRSRFCHSVDLFLKAAYQKAPSMAVRHFRVCNATACMGGICLHSSSEHCQNTWMVLASVIGSCTKAQPLNSITVHLMRT